MTTSNFAPVPASASASASAPAPTLAALNAADPATASALLDGLYEHSPWIAERALARRPFASLAQLQRAMVEVLDAAGAEAQLALLRAHPELAGKAMVSRALTAESSREQRGSGLTDCTPEEFEQLQRLNAAYNARFGWPFILAVRGPRGTGLDRATIIATFARRLENPPAVERAECIHQVHRVVELRLADKFGLEPRLGQQVWDWAEALARHSDPGFAERGELTVTYLTEAHRACAADLRGWMADCGFDDIETDAVGNVVGVYRGLGEVGADGAAIAPAPRLLTGSHYDTVRNAGRHDGRLGILLPMACVRELARAGRRLPFAIEVVGFAEEEGQRYKATFLGSGALVGRFDPAWLDQRDADGVPMREAMRAAGLPGTLASIEALQRDARRYLGFVEVHIEQGPVLDALGLPLGVVGSINGSVRHSGIAIGMASHAGTTPMNARRDAAAATSELALYLERCAAGAVDVVGTMGILAVPDGSTNVVPGRCRFTLDIRATTDAARDACVAEVLAEAGRIAARRGVEFRIEETMRAAAAPCDAAWRGRWATAVAALGLPVHHMPSGAGHDAMQLHEAMPQAMLFVRGENAGISHNPLESTTAHDIDLAAQAFGHLLEQLAAEFAATRSDAT